MSANTALLERRTLAVGKGVGTSTPVYAARAENAEIWDADGRRYVDFATGIAVVNTGHRHPRVIAAVTEQLERYTHTAFQVMAYEPYIELAERLNAMAPIEGPAKTVLFTTGAEAVENAIKVARAATGRPGVVAFAGAFHGRTTLTMALTGKVSPYKRMFGPPSPAIFHAPFPMPHYGITTEDSLRALDFIFRADIAPEQVAAIIIEPVQGEGGFHPAPPELMRALRALCDKHGMMLIADEVQSGFARTGKMFACEHSEVKPDLITVAKALAGGFPLSGLIGRADLMDAVEPGGLGGTYGGSPIACAAALAVLDVIADEKLCARATELGVQSVQRLQALARRNDLQPIAAVRGLGSMVGFDLVSSRGGHEPDAAAAKAVTSRALSEGLVLLGCGAFGETIRLLYPLTISDQHFAEGFEMLEKALGQA